MRFVLKLALVLVLALLTSVFVWYRRTQTTGLSHLIVPVQAAGPPAAKRPVYPHSVIPGGVASGKEVRESMASDPVVAKHYQGIRPERLRAGKLTRNASVYISYRTKDKVYWTRRKVRLRKGELILCDGADCIRARCGNRIAFLPQRPFLTPADEPQETDFDTPLPDIPVQVADLGVVPDFSGPVPPFRESGTPTVVATRTGKDKKEKQLIALRHRIPLAGQSAPARASGSPGQPGDISGVPEPGSILLVAAGLAGIAMLRLRR